MLASQREILVSFKMLLLFFRCQVKRVLMISKHCANAASQLATTSTSQSLRLAGAIYDTRIPFLRQKIVNQ